MSKTRRVAELSEQVPRFLLTEAVPDLILHLLSITIHEVGVNSLAFPLVMINLRLREISSCLSFLNPVGR